MCNQKTNLHVEFQSIKFVLSLQRGLLLLISYNSQIIPVPSLKAMLPSSHYSPRSSNCSLPCFGSSLSSQLVNWINSTNSYFSHTFKSRLIFSSNEDHPSHLQLSTSAPRINVNPQFLPLEPLYCETLLQNNRPQFDTIGILLTKMLSFPKTGAPQYFP